MITNLHARQGFLPALDHFVDLELDRLSTRKRAIELETVIERSAIVNGNLAGRTNFLARAILDDRVNEVLVSPVSYWEISLKYGLGKLKLPETDPSEIPAAATQLGLTEVAMAPDILATFHRSLCFMEAGKSVYNFLGPPTI